MAALAAPPPEAQGLCSARSGSRKRTSRPRRSRSWRRTSRRTRRVRGGNRRRAVQRRRYVNIHAGRFIRELGASVKRRVRRDNRLRRHDRGAGPGCPPWRVPVPGLRRSARLRAPTERSVCAAGPARHDRRRELHRARSGRPAGGLRLVRYGPERDVVGAALPALLKAAADERCRGGVPGQPRVQGAGARDPDDHRIADFDAPP